MTRIAIRRCDHCRVRYSYQASGANAPELNDGTWCPDCALVVRTALATRPRLYEEHYRDVSELDPWYQVPLETLIMWEDEFFKNRKKISGVDAFLSGAQRIWPALVDMTTGESQNCREIRGMGEHREVRFRVSTWRTRPDYKIEVPWEWDLIEQKWTARPWH